MCAKSNALCERMELRQLLSTVLVNTLQDETIANSTTSLREALTLAKAGDTVGFAGGLTGSIDLTSGKELLIDKNLIISGPGPGAISISGVSATRVLNVASLATATISGLRILNGNADTGAGIYNAGNLTLDNVVIANNVAQGKFGDSGPDGTQNPDGHDGRGGGIFNTGELKMTNVTLGGNKAVGGHGVMSSTASGKGGAGLGAGLYNSAVATATISSATIAGNNAVGGEGYKGTAGGYGGLARGAGIYSAGSLNVSDSTFSGNAATGHDGADAYMGPGGEGGTGEGGALYTIGSADILRCDLSSNLAIGGEGGVASIIFFNTPAAGGNAAGGAIHSTGSLLITSSRIRDNVARGGRVANGEGGGIFSRGSLTLQTTTVDNNAARSRRDLPGQDGKTGGQGIGGGISAADATINNSTISNNRAEGGLGGKGFVIKLTTNPAGYGGAARGGGLFLTGVVSINNSTIARNLASGGNGGDADFTIRAGNGGDASGGGIFVNLGARIEPWSTTIAANSAIEGSSGASSDPVTNGAKGASSGGGIEQQGITSPLSTIVAGNSALTSPDVHGAVTTHGFNLIGKSDGSSGWTASDQKGTVASPLDAKLGDLADNGGATRTMLPQPTSPAVDAGVKTSQTDQRGLARTFDVPAKPNAAGSDGTDVGAVELQSTPYLGTALAISAAGPATLQLENFDEGGESVAYHDQDAANQGGAYRSSGVDLQPASDAGAGFNVGWAVAGEWLNYTVDVVDAGVYIADFRVASNGPGGKFHLELDGGADLTGQLTIPNTFGWQNWTTISRNIVLSPGRHTLRLVMDSVGTTGAVGNFNWVRFTPNGPLQTPFKGTPFVIGAAPVTIQAEDFDKGGEAVAYHDIDAANVGGQYRAGEAVDIQATSDSGGGYNVGWVRSGEWLEYSIDVATSAFYNFDFRIASTGSNGAFHVEIDGLNVTGKMPVTNTGGWQNWTTLSRLSVNLSAGKHVMRLVMDADGTTGAVANFNWIRISPAQQQVVTINSSAAAFVRDGDFANTNYGSDPDLLVKDSTPGFKRESYVKFDLSSVDTINSAKLRLFGALRDPVNFSVNVEVSWSLLDWNESSITWNNRPIGRTVMGSFAVTGNTGNFYQFDVTELLKAQKAAGHNVVTFVLRSLTFTSTLCDFASDEAANGPQLVIS